MQKGSLRSACTPRLSGTSTQALMLAVFVALVSAGSDATQVKSSLTLNSSSPELNAGFAWAKEKALQLVLTDKPDCKIPSYSAAMSIEQFCVRDVAHQLEGAHLLGLDTENYSMMNSFAWGANRRKGSQTTDYFWPNWHYRYNVALDQQENFRSCNWRCLPTSFDMAWRCYEQYLWTGDEKWISEELFTFHQNLHDADNGFMKYQDVNTDGIADERAQLASFFEFPDATIKNISAGDSLGTQYQALLAYAAILAKKGDLPNAQKYLNKAKEVNACFETYWYDEAKGLYGNGMNFYGMVQTAWGKEASFFIPMTLLGDLGPRVDRYLDFVDNSIIEQNKTTSPLNIEAQTYLPEVFYKHNKREIAWKYLQNILNSKAGYPEVSYACIGNTIAGLMGVMPDAPNNAFYTVPRLPVSGLAWVEVDHVPINGRDLFIRHDGNMKTTVKNNSGQSINWGARFYGNYAKLKVNGVERTTKIQYLNGKTISVVSVALSAGQVAVVETVGKPAADLPLLSAKELELRTQSGRPKPGYYDVSEMSWTYGILKDASPAVKDKNVNNGPLMVGGKSTTKGLGVRGASVIRYELNKGYSHLITEIGFDDTNSVQGYVEFVILGGAKMGRTLFASGTMKPDSPAQKFSIDVSDCNYVILGTRPLNDGDASAVVNWANPQLIAKGTTVDTIPPSRPVNLKLVEARADSATVSWGAATDNVGVNAYRVYLDGKPYGSTYTTTLSVAGLIPKTTHLLTVKAMDLLNNSSVESAPLSFTTREGIRKTYLSDLQWDKANIGYGGVVANRSVMGKELKVGGRVYTKGIGVHAITDVTYKLDKVYNRFRAVVGVDDSASSGSVEFEVYGDGQKLASSGVLVCGVAKELDVDISGVAELKIRATDAGNGINSDHADWADARVLAIPANWTEAEQ